MIGLGINEACKTPMTFDQVCAIALHVSGCFGNDNVLRSYFASILSEPRSLQSYSQVCEHIDIGARSWHDLVKMDAQAHAFKCFWHYNLSFSVGPTNVIFICGGLHNMFYGYPWFCCITRLISICVLATPLAKEMRFLLF